MTRALSLATLVFVGCVQPGGDAAGRVDLSSFVEGTSIVGRVVENVTACEVDAVCFLHIEFADTTVAAIYGTGQEPNPPCEVPVAVSNPSFGARPGDLVEVVISTCGSEGLYLKRIAPDAG